MEEKLNDNVLTKEYVLNCIAKYEKKINKLAYKEKQYRSVAYNNYKAELNELIQYRQPFIEFLMKEYRMSINDIKSDLLSVKEKNIPSKSVCDMTRNIIVNGFYKIDD